MRSAYAGETADRVALLRGRADRSGLLRRHDGTTAHVVDVSDTITHALALDVLARAREHFAKLRAAANASMVLDANGDDIAEVRFYKSGARGLSVRAQVGRYRAGILHDGRMIWHDASHVRELLADFDRDGLIKWPRATSAAEKARVLAGVAHNAAIDEYVAAMQAMLVFDTERDAVREFLQSPGSNADKQALVEALTAHDAAVNCDDGRANPGSRSR